MKPIIIALGGNALIREHEIGKYEQQLKNVKESSKQIAKAVKKGYNVIITHGNGPQIGNLELQMKKAKETVPEMPLHVEGAMTQGQIGYMIQKSLQELLPNKKIATIITQIAVNEKDPAFNNPTKPIGPAYTEQEAKTMQKKGLQMIYQKKKGYRKVVASPKPKKIMEIETIKQLLGRKNIIICCGGGGIPVIQKGKKIIGIEAVIDKDHATQLLANSIKANILVILTNTEFVKLNFGTMHEKNLEKAHLKQMKNYLMHGEFEEGSMKPKIEAAINFLNKGGRKVIITSLNKLMSALNEETGTIISK